MPYFWRLKPISTKVSHLFQTQKTRVKLVCAYLLINKKIKQKSKAKISVKQGLNFYKLTNSNGLHDGHNNAQLRFS